MARLEPAKTPPKSHASTRNPFLKAGWQNLLAGIRGRDTRGTRDNAVTTPNDKVDRDKDDRTPSKNDDGMKLGPRPKAAFSLVTPHDANSEWTPKDRDITPSDPDLTEQGIVDLVHARLEESWRASETYRRTWWRCLAFVRGNYWFSYDRVGRFASSKDPNDPYRAYDACNIITPLVARNATRVLQAKPDANVKPLTGAAKDRAAAACGRAIIATCDQEFDRLDQNYELIYTAETFGGVYLKKIWNPLKKARVVTKVDKETGEVLESKEKQVGGIEEHVRTPLEIFLDPKSIDRQDIAWLMEARLVSLGYVHEKFGKDAREVEGGSIPDWYVTGLANYKTALTGDVLTDNQLLDPKTRAQMCLLIECWEKPTDRYRNGRLITAAGGRVVRYEEWPYDKDDDFPYTYLPYHHNVSSVYSQGLVEMLLDLQESYNHIQSRIVDRINIDFPAVICREGSEIGVDAFTSPRNLRMIIYRGDVPPQYQTTPGVPSYWLEEQKILEIRMRQIAGVGEIGDGKMPSSDVSGTALENMMWADASQAAEFLAHIEQFHVKRGEWEIALYRQYAQERRLMAIADVDAPDSIGNAVEFSSLRNGGNCRVVVTPGSAIPKSAQARQEKLDQWYSSGIFGPPGQVASIEAYLLLSGETKSDVIVDAATKAIMAAQQAAEKQMQMETQSRMAQAVAQQQDQPDPAQEVQAKYVLADQAARHQAALQSELSARKAEDQMATDQYRAMLKVQTEATLMGLQQAGATNGQTPEAAAENGPAAVNAIPAPPQLRQNPLSTAFPAEQTAMGSGPDAAGMPPMQNPYGVPSPQGGQQNPNLM